MQEQERIMNVVREMCRGIKIWNQKCWWGANESLERHKLKLNYILESTHELEKVDCKHFGVLQMHFEVGTPMIVNVFVFSLNEV